MSLKFENRFPSGNARRISVKQEGDLTEVAFAPEPGGGAECLWFYFRLTETAPEEAPGGKVKLVLRHLDNLLGANLTTGLRPVYKPAGKDWFRLRQGRMEVHPDGRHDLSWIIDYPAPSTEVALCFPYGAAEVSQLTSKTKGYWTSSSIGLSEGGRTINRLSNTFGTMGGKLPGIYLLSRQHGGETPGSWVLDGLLREFARTRSRRAVVWVAPLLNIDGITRGDYGRDSSVLGFDSLWGDAAGRHEIIVLKRDVERWKERCQPFLSLDFMAPGASASDGLFCALPSHEENSGLRKKSLGWGNHFSNFVTPKYAAPDFIPSTEHKSHWQASGFVNWISRHLDICALTINAPYALAGENLLSRKCYREAGKAIAAAILDRLKQ